MSDEQPPQAADDPLSREESESMSTLRTILRFRKS